MNYRQRISALQTSDVGRSVFGAAHHQWALGPVWSEARIAEFERTRRFEFPTPFRRWLREVGASGAFPGNGLFEPGTIDTGGGVEPISTRRFGPLGDPFPFQGPVDRHKGALPGALPICDLGCGQVVVLANSGDQRGRIWVDRRLDRSGVAPEADLLFDEWIDMWLSAADAEVANPWKPEPRRANLPEVMRQAPEVVDPEALEEWLAEVHADLKATSRAKLPGWIGEICRRQAHYVFDQGSSLQKLMAGEPLRTKGVAADLFRALATWPPWTGVEVEGLFQAWVREERRGEARDYLGRPTYFGREGRFLTIKMTATP